MIYSWLLSDNVVVGYSKSHAKVKYSTIILSAQIDKKRSLTNVNSKEILWQGYLDICLWRLRAML